MLAIVLAGLIAVPAAPPAGPPKLDGVWFLDAASLADSSKLGMLWGSTLTIAGDKATLSDFLGAGKPYGGTFALDPATPGAADLTLDAFDLTPLGAPLKIDAGVRRAAFTVTGDRLTVVFAVAVGGRRPVDTAPTKDRAFARIVAARAPAGVTTLPDAVTVRVTDAAGKPAAGAALTTFMSAVEKTAKPPAPGVGPAERPVEYTTLATTGPDGTAVVRYSKLSAGVLVARDSARKQIAVARITPAGLAAGTAGLTLSAECRVTVPAACPALEGSTRPVYLDAYIYKDQERFMYANTKTGNLTFLAPAGDYTVSVYGHDVVGKTVTLSVPADGRSALTAPPVELKAANLALLRGKPAPEFAGVVGYSGAPFKLADFRGKFVVIDFWGYWCNPCTEAMPALFEVHDKLKDEVVVVTVHEDAGGEVDTAAKLAARLTSIRKRQWADRELPLRTALVSGAEEAKAGGVVERYGVTGWPTTVLVAPDGTVVGDLHFRNKATAVDTLRKAMAKAVGGGKKD